MGYTHYWRTKTTSQAKFGAAIKKANKVLEARKGLLAGPNGEGPLVIKKKQVCFNGQGDESHETCFIDNSGKEFDFCKTAQKPYDDVVTAVLAIFAHELGEDFQVSSDGDHEEWASGVKLASQVLGEPVPNPIVPDADEQECTFLVRVKGVDAEALRVHLLSQYGVGLISIGSSDIRVAFSCLEESEAEPLFDCVHRAIQDLRG